MKLFTVQIHKTVNHVFCLDNQSQYEKSFVIQNNTTHPVLLTLPKGNLTEFDKPGFSLMTENGEKNVFVSSIVESEVMKPPMGMMHRSLTIRLVGKAFSDFLATTKEQKEQLRKVNESIHKTLKKRDVSNCFNESSGEYCIQLEKATTVISYSVNLILELFDVLGQATEESSSCRIILTPAGLIYHAALDFGSEATQVMEYNLKDTTVSSGNITHIFRDMASLFNKDIVFDKHCCDQNREFIQYDEDERLFRSHFFATKTVSGLDTFNPSEALNNKHFTMFNSYEEADAEDFKIKYFTLPNVKIASLMHQTPEIIIKDGDKVSFEKVTSFKNRFFYRSAINAFIYQILRDVSAKSKLVDAPFAFLSLTVLMPNVYDQKQLAERMQDIHEDINGMICNEEFRERIGGVEVNSISESDASILGWMNVNIGKTLLLKKGNYLIMDAGKGTLDFSVLHFNPDAPNREHYTCLYRSGIVGSGNALSYALFVDLMTMMLQEYDESYARKEHSEKCIKRIIQELIANGDESYLAEMMRYIDHYKCLLSKGSLKTRPKKSPSRILGALLQQANQTDLGDGSNHTTPKVSLNNKYPLVLTDIVEWLKLLFEYPLNPLSSDFAYRTGEFPYLKRMIDELADDALKKFGFKGRIDYVVLSGRGFRMSQFKEAVLERLKSVKNWRDFEELDLGGPQNDYNAKNICMFICDMISSGEYDGRVVGKPEHLKQGEDPFLYKPDDQLKKAGWWQRSIVIKWIQKTIIKLFADAGGTTVLSDESFFKGIPVHIKTTADLICISGTYYKLPRNAQNGAKATIYFNGTEFVFVCNNTVEEFQPALLSEVTHLYESMFPYGIIPSNLPLLDGKVGNQVLIPNEKERYVEERPTVDLQEIIKNM